MRREASGKVSVKMAFLFGGRKNYLKCKIAVFIYRRNVPILIIFLQYYFLLVRKQDGVYH